MKALHQSVETLGRECNSTGLCIHFNTHSETRKNAECFKEFAVLAINSKTVLPRGPVRVNPY